MNEFWATIVVVFGLPAVYIGLPIFVTAATLNKVGKRTPEETISLVVGCCALMFALSFFYAKWFPTNAGNGIWIQTYIFPKIVAAGLLAGCFFWLTMPVSELFERREEQKLLEAQESKNHKLRVEAEAEHYRLQQEADARQRQKDRMTREADNRRLQEQKEIAENRSRVLSDIQYEITQYVKSFVSTSKSQLSLVSASDIVPNRGALVDRIRTISVPHQRYISDAMYAYQANMTEVSEEVLLKVEFERGKRVSPTEYKGDDVIERYLRNTPFLGMVQNMRVPLGIPDDLRPEHGIIVGQSGQGKSQLLEKLILADLDQSDPPGMLIIDSKTNSPNAAFRNMSLFNRVARLGVFHPDHGRLRDRLIIIDPVEDKPALNMFDFRGQLTATKVDQIYDSMRYFFGALLGNDLSSLMDTIFIPLLHIVLRVPGATLSELQALVRDPLKYPDVLDEIPSEIRNFIVNELAPKRERGNQDEYRASRTGLVTRIHGIILKTVLNDMFSAPSNAVDVADALGKGAIILVSTNFNALRGNSAIFGKFWISQVLNAGMANTTGRRIHFYCDETEPYVDDKFVSLLTTIRSYNVGVMSAFQGVWQMGSHVQGILANSNIKFLSGGAEPNVKALASYYRGMDVEELMSAQKVVETEARFAMNHGKLKRSVVVQFPFGELDRLPRMSEQDYRLLRVQNKKRVEGGDANRRVLAAQPSSETEPKPAVEKAAPANTEAYRRKLVREFGADVMEYWPLFEEQLNRITGRWGTAEERIDRLNLSNQDKEILHSLRKLRNKPSHERTDLSNEDIQAWAQNIQAYTKILVGIGRSDPSDASPER